MLRAACRSAARALPGYPLSTPQPAVPRKSLWSSLFLAVMVAALNVGLWAYINRPVAIANWSGPVGGFAFSAFQRYQSPLQDSYPSDEELASDLRVIARNSDRVRTYSSLESAAIPRLARDLGLSVLAGAWIDRRIEHNDVELDALVSAAQRWPNIDRVIVGNESLLRDDVTVEQLTRYLDRVRAAVRQPVSTAEPWHIWLKHPELARHVDFITVHLLPYWEGIPRKDAIGYVLMRYEELQRAFPDKKIVIGEVGWPSYGDRKRFADPTLADQAHFIRDWLNVARERRLDYYLMEAFDQPWKEQGEGRAGAYWGVFGADREPKFSMIGPVIEDPQWPWKAIAASLLAFFPMWWFAWKFTRFRVTGRVFFLALLQLSAGVLVWSTTVPYSFYLDPIDWAMLFVLLPAQMAIIAILLINAFEFTEVIWRRRWVRQFGLLTPTPDQPQPFVSIHLACANEPPEMVILTIDSLAALDYDNYEVLVIDNNTKNEAVWKPVEEHCATLGPRFRFFHLDPWPGFKAGALNYGLEQTDARAEVIAVVDADYAVRPDWLRALTGYFLDPKIAVVQCPQAHRDWEHNRFRRMTNWEYDGFFRIGMHHRNERNAIIQHGTMTMVRRDALERTGRWSEWTICEDAELGLRLMQEGLELVYVDEVMGRGLTPADFTAYKSQRYRWAFGAMQILKARWGWMTSPGRLSAGQRFHFLTGWFSWFADALHLVFTLMALTWTALMLGLPEFFSLPLQLFLIPIMGFFIFKALFGIVLYRVRVPCSWNDTIAASVASMALSHAIARGIFMGLVKKKGEFVRTAKSRRLSGRPSPFSSVREELLMFVALLVGIVGMMKAYGFQYTEGKLWMVILAAQAIPYVSALIGAWVPGRAGERAG
jgi:exo-beta-1,3-glucanase (GH17 family)/cellulose synthase/poly-beta-1,6-N-acetylglucosamine synthase-like glycosyltransferase